MPARHADAMWAALGWAVAALHLWDRSDAVNLPQMTRWAGMPAQLQVWALGTVCKALLRGMTPDQQRQVLEEIAVAAEAGAVDWDGSWPRVLGALPGWDEGAGR